MKNALTILLTSALLVSFLTACGSSSYSEDDSWKSKTYNNLTSSEKVKADKYIQSQAERIYK